MHVIRISGSSIVCKASEGESILTACTRAGVILSAPCGGQGRCGKCKIRVLEGAVTGDEPDAAHRVRACLVRPVSDVTIEYPENHTITGGELFSKAAGNRPARAGVALDIGTTTVCARLIDLDTALPLDTLSEQNDQRAFGADVMSRIGAARNGKTEELFSVINRQAERILKTFQERWNLQRIEKLSVSGNTTMLHFFLNVNPSAMGEFPFTPVFLHEREMSGESLSLSAGSVMILPSVSAFIGADVTAGLAALDILNIPAPSLFVDIGTNGEMALFNQGSILCCSTAAGPAFEGADISCGMFAASGAISAVDLINETTVAVTTIGNALPRGICGSGLIDAVAVMLKQGIIDETGSMESTEYFLTPEVSITNRDVRQFQLAKSAIFSGIKILCKSGGLNFCDIKNVYIAGGLGSFINRENAIYTGLFPKEFIASLSACGNLSLQGAEELLVSKNFIQKCNEIIGRCSVIDLSADSAFAEEFAENMLFC